MRRLAPSPSLWDGAGLTMAWDESLCMERQSGDEMVAQDRGRAAVALVSLPPCGSHTPTCHTAGRKPRVRVPFPAGPLSQATLGARAKVPPRCWH